MILSLIETSFPRCVKSFICNILFLVYLSNFLFDYLFCKVAGGLCLSVSVGLNYSAFPWLISYNKKNIINRPFVTGKFLYLYITVIFYVLAPIPIMIANRMQGDFGSENRWDKILVSSCLFFKSFYCIAISLTVHFLDLLAVS